MAGTIEGGLITAQKNKAKDPDFYVKLGRKSQEAWVKNGRKPRGFSVMDKEKLKEAGRRGGSARLGYRKSAKLGTINETELNQLAQALQAEAKVVR